MHTNFQSGHSHGWDMLVRGWPAPRSALIVLAVLASLPFAPPAYAESALEFAAAGMGRSGAIVQPLHPAARERHHEPRGAIQTMIAEHVSARIGSQWVSTALRIAKIESGFRCNARFIVSQ